MESLPNKAAGDQLSKVVQGSSEPYSEFVSCLMQLAEKIFGDVDTAMPGLACGIIRQIAGEIAEDLVRLPMILPNDLEDPEYPVYLYRPKRDFDVTTAIVAAIGISTAAATAAGIAVSQNV
ncbi:hypothetical protein STEG23_014010 [Scotinomys teguina]